MKAKILLTILTLTVWLSGNDVGVQATVAGQNQIGNPETEGLS